MLVHGAIDGMVQSLNDRHSAFLSPTDNHRLQETESGRYAGLGISVRIDDGRLVIVQVFDDSPAAAAGLKAGDVIVSATDIDPDGLREPVTHDLTDPEKIRQSTAILRGKEGSKITLGILRDGQRLDITVQRGEIQRPVVEHRMLDDGIGYLRIGDFPDDVSGRVRAALDGLRAKNARAVVVDLRRNFGGFLDEAVRVADLFIAQGVIVSTRNRNELENKVSHAAPGGPAEDLPLAALVDGQTASAGEVLAGALQDHGRAVLVGTRTYGKGAVSKRFPLPDGSGILLSTGEYLLPKGRQIEGKGLQPDLVAERPQTKPGERPPPGVKPPDPQLDAAVKLLRERLAQAPGAGP